MRFTWTLAVLGNIWALPCLGEGEDWEARLRAEYPVAVEKLEAAVRTALCVAKVQFGDGGSGECSFFLKEGSRAATCTRETSVGRSLASTLVQCRTKKYCFTLRRSAPDKPFVVESVDNQPRSVRESLSYRANIDAVVDGAFVAFDIPLREIIEHPSFSVTETAEGEQDGEKWVIFKFHCDDPNRWASGGTMRLLPSLHWAIAELDLTMVARAGSGMPTGSHFKKWVKYREWPSGQVFPSEIWEGFVYPSGEPEPPMHYRFLEYTPKQIDDSQFRLSAFGLPDSLLRPEAGWSAPAWVSFATLGLLSLLVAIALRFFGSRGTSKHSATTTQ